MSPRKRLHDDLSPPELSEIAQRAIEVPFITL
jgi:hypothetical protein